ncbi:MAG: M56 family metallopeptidase [Sphingobacteriales bacterium]|nr:MAG: M56 family metallopeptidase [Sphingobacteriales bacterium]
MLSSVISFYFIYSTPFLDYREDVQSLLQSLSASQSWLQQYAPVVFTLYAFGLLYKLSYAWFNWKKFNRFYKASLLKPSVDVRLFTQAKALHFGIKRKVTIWCSRHIQTPVTFGFFKPVILLPVALVNQLNLQQTESLIVHELTHIKNNDYLFNWLILIADAIFFFNPFIKIAVQKIKVEREKNCDVQVLQFNYPAISYAEALLYIAQQQQSNTVLAPVAAVNKKTELLDRIRYFSDDKNITAQQTRHFSFAALFIWTFILLNVFFAGVFVSTTKPGSANPLSTFAAAPLNEWNKSFATEAKYELPQADIASKIVEEMAPAAEEEENYTAIVTEAKQPAPEPIKLTLEVPAEPAYKFTAVSYPEPATVTITVKDVIIDEEISGAKVTQAYRVTTSVTGEVKMEPLWMISEVKQTSDSLKLAIKKDSSVITIIPTVQ